MLGKLYGCTLVSKLRAVLLMEADFNFSNKMIYGVRMMNNVRKFGWLPEEIYSEKGKAADDGSLAKVLFYDIVRQARVSAGLSSIDTANCYDSMQCIDIHTFHAWRHYRHGAGLDGFRQAHASQMECAHVLVFRRQRW